MDYKVTTSETVIVENPNLRIVATEDGALSITRTKTYNGKNTSLTIFIRTEEVEMLQYAINYSY